MRIVFTLLLLLFCQFALSQSKNKVVDSSLKQKDYVKSLIVKSNNLFNDNEFKQAVDIAIEAVNAAHKINDPSLVSAAYLLLGNQNFELLDVKRAKKNFEKALHFAKIAKDSIALYESYNSMGNVISDGEKKFEPGLVYYEKSLEIAKALKDTLGIIRTKANLGWTYMDMLLYDKAYAKFLEAENYNENYSGRQLRISCDLMYLKGRYFAAKKDYQLAEDYYEKALQKAKKNSYFFIASDILKHRALLFQEKNELNKSISDLKLFQKYKDSINKAKELEAIETAKAKFELSQYERELDLARREQEFSKTRADENQKKLLLSILLSVLSIGLIYFYFNNLSKKKTNETLREKNKFLEEAKQKSENLNALKSQFISTVSHELRTPLYGVIGITSLLADDDRMTNDQKKLISSLKQSGDFLLKHINDVLKIGEIESKNEDVEIGIVIVENLIEKLKIKFSSIAKENTNTLSIEVDDDVPKAFFTDKLRLTEVLTNLLDNACKFTSEGHIWLRIKKCSNTLNHVSLCFEVEDDGIGISDSVKEVIFDKFYQANRGQKNLDGTGLGLSVVKYLLHSLNSIIQVESEKDKGSKFYFKLNVEVAKNVPNISQKEENKLIKRRILIAEDNKVSQTITKKMVESLGHHCVVCDNGLETLNESKKAYYDLILMDLNMPVMDGITSAKNILEHDNSIPIVALTALELSEIKSECYAVGMLYAVNKPLKKNDLNKIIEKYALNSFKSND